MKFDELVDLVSEDAYNIAKNKIDIFPSKIIGLCLYRHKHEYSSDEDITTKNNPFGTINPKTGEVLSFDSIYNGICNGLDDNFVMENIDLDEVDRLIKVWYLEKYDLAFIKTIDKVMVDLDEDSKIPFTDMYTVHKGNTILITTPFINEAIAIAQRNEGSTMTNSTGKVIDLNKVTTFSDIETHILAPATNIDGPVSANTKIICTNMNLYKTPTDGVPTRCINGVYYVYDDNEINGMIHICRKTILNGSDLTVPVGYVKKSE